MLKPIRYIKRVRTLKKHGWYKSMSGKYVEGHVMRLVTKKRLYKMTDKEFEELL